MARNKVRISICGSDYFLMAEESGDYVKELAREVERRMEEIMKDNRSVSVTMAAILTAMNCCDDESKAIMAADNLRTQLKEYLADSARYRTEAEEAKREVLQLKSRLAELRQTAAPKTPAPKKVPDENQIRMTAPVMQWDQPHRNPVPKELTPGEFMSLFDALQRDGKKEE